MVDILTCGWASLQTLREACEELKLAIHAHRAFHATFTRNPLHGVSMLVVSDIARLTGVDQLHIGTVIGKLESPEAEVLGLRDNLQKRTINAYRTSLGQDWGRIRAVFPTCSGGLHPGQIPDLMKIVGTDIIIQAGGGIWGHPDGGKAGATALRQAIKVGLNGANLKDYASQHKSFSERLKPGASLPTSEHIPNPLNALKWLSEENDGLEYMSTHRYVACDLGAESCRVILGTLTGESLAIEEIHRFSNRPTSVFRTLRWDVLRIFDELKIGLRKIAARGDYIESISTDSWGLDYVHIYCQEPMLASPYNYRDTRTEGSVEKASAVVSPDLMYNETGIQSMQVNTLYQLLDDLEHRPELLELSEQFLGVGDYFNYLLSGVRVAEESLASTTQLFNPTLHKWSQQLIENFQLPARIFPKLVPSGTKLGALLPSIADDVGLQDTQVVASCSHDTACAVAAVPAEGKDWSYNSSGTWSLVGIETAEPIINPMSREHNFSNEMGYGGRIRFLKGLVGLWIVQECRREWAKRGQEYSYDELSKMAMEAEPLKSLIYPNAQRFWKPNDMPQKIIKYCVETNQAAPKTHGEVIRCVLESLALLYRQTLQDIATITGHKARSFHIVGGGSRNRLLNQFSANATQMTVLSGPSEATAIGNILVQAIALGHLGSLSDLRRVVRSSFPVTIYQPRDEATWEGAYQEFEDLTLKL